MHADFVSDFQIGVRYLTVIEKIKNGDDIIILCQDISESASVLKYLHSTFGDSIFDDDYNREIAEHLMSGQAYENWQHVCLCNGWVYFYDKGYYAGDALNAFGKENVYTYEVFSNEVCMPFIEEITPVDNSQLAAFF